MAVVAESGRSRTNLATPTTRAFPCSQCNASFNRAAHLRRHVTARMTSGNMLDPMDSSLTTDTDKDERPHNCNHCSVSSSRKDVITRHMRNFHPEIVSSETDDRRSRKSATRNQSRRKTSSPPALEAETSPNPPPPVDTTSSSANQRQSLPSTTVPDGTEHPPQEPLGSMDLYGTDFMFLDETVLPGSHQLLDLLLDDQMVDPNLWPIFSPAQMGATPSAQPQANFSKLTSPRSLHSSPRGSDGLISDQTFTVEDDQFVQIRANLDQHDQSRKLVDFQLPSKYAIARFLKAFFEHMAPHLPIIHRATFDVVTVPSKLEETLRNTKSSNSDSLI